MQYTYVEPTQAFAVIFSRALYGLGLVPYGDSR